MREEIATGRPDRLVAAIAARQHGVVSTAQLRAAGLSRSGIERRVASGRLHAIHRGVYAVGHAGLSNEGTWMAAVLVCGKGAALSHRSAAMLWGMLTPRQATIHVTVPGSAGRARRKGLYIHRSSILSPSQTTLRANIPVTKPSRTLSDLHRAAPEAEFREALRQAQFRRLPLGQTQTDRTRSELERNLLAICRRHRLPPPAVNVRIGPYLVDFLWRESRLVVEVDGWGAHGTRSAFEDDRARDVELKLLGYDVVRFTYLQVIERPAETAAKLRTLLCG